jgi:hypothetical protein
MLRSIRDHLERCILHLLEVGNLIYCCINGTNVLSDHLGVLSKGVIDIIRNHLVISVVEELIKKIMSR